MDRSHPSRGDEAPSSSGRLARFAYARAAGLGATRDQLLKKAGLTLRQIEDPNARMPAVRQIKFLNLIAEAIGDDLLGFHLAQTIDLREIGWLYYVLASSDVLSEAFVRAARYSTLVNDGVVQTPIQNRYFGMALRYSGVSRHLDRHQIEFWMTVLLRICRQLTARRLVPERVRFAHRRNDGVNELSEFFGGQIEFGAAADDILFDADTAKCPIVSADPYLNKLLVAYCEDALSRRLSTRSSFRSSVENAIVPLLPHGNARAEQIARRLGVSQRTFARRLADENLTFSEVLENLRAELAARYLADVALSISQIAWLLGYREVGAFSHAFKRWTGKTPREMRLQMAA